ncbi:endonuclease/exonuclease/phosphatase family protein [Nostoc sp. CMAA1605]|uniref:endonuclease/exonuclease/phosphatase family protein n=1 Tax=Nostoc sp. CMAA1605 TaxID=2055159 RepID=UPI001F476277|nr:endonuclease/exonuclease/phosphatase family protein [Nostoc sp. CMAA1605]MCF4966559.1 endonuclease/exonuclease/phosphatase family protein [Nostoc sp. CMAA1605]
MSQRIALIVAIATLVILGLLSLFPYIAWSWPLELISHFRYQYFILSLLASIILFILWRIRYLKHKILFLTAILLLGINLVEVLPWYLPHNQQITTHTAKPLRILSFNLNIQNQAQDKIVDLVTDSQADIALLLEIDQQAFTIIQPQLKPSFPYSFRSPGGGLALFSKFPIQDARADNFNKKAKHNLVANLAIDNKLITFIGTHPLVPVKPATFHSRNLQLAAIAEYIQNINQPLILAGDFNLTPWSPYYRRFVHKTKLHNTRLGFGILPSWPRPATHVNLPYWLIPLMNIPIDHCFVSKHFQVVRTYTGGNANSDHAALITELVLP